MAAPQWDSATLETRVRERCDMVNSGFVSSAEVQRFLEAAWGEFFGIVSGEFEDALLSKYTLVTTQGVSSYPFPFQPRKLRALRLKNEYFLGPVSLREVERFDWQSNTGKPTRYWVYSEYPSATDAPLQFQLLPTPDATYYIDVFYVPSVALADVTKSAAMAHIVGWDEYLVLTAAIKCKDKEESDVSVLMAERASLLDNIKKNWTPMDTSEPPRVVQLEGTSLRRELTDMDLDPVFS